MTRETQHPAWPLWKKAAAYLILLALAMVLVWLVDRRVQKLPPREDERVRPAAATTRLMQSTLRDVLRRGYQPRYHSSVASSPGRKSTIG